MSPMGVRKVVIATMIYGTVQYEMSCFVKEEWDKEVPTMLIKGLRAKFSQVGFCKEFLKSMDTKNIGEANLHDGFYSIVMSVTDKRPATMPLISYYFPKMSPITIYSH